MSPEKTVNRRFPFHKAIVRSDIVEDIKRDVKTLRENAGIRYRVAKKPIDDQKTEVFLVGQPRQMDQAEELLDAARRFK